MVMVTKIRAESKTCAEKELKIAISGLKEFINYKLYPLDRSDCKVCVVLYIRNDTESVDFHFLFYYQGTSLVPINFETEKLLVGCIYRPPFSQHIVNSNINEYLLLVKRFLMLKNLKTSSWSQTSTTRTFGAQERKTSQYRVVGHAFRQPFESVCARAQFWQQYTRPRHIRHHFINLQCKCGSLLLSMLFFYLFKNVNYKETNKAFKQTNLYDLFKKKDAASASHLPELSENLT